MDNRQKVLTKMKALRNFAFESDDPEVQAIGHVLNTVLLAYHNGHELELMKVMAGFTMTKIDQNKLNGNNENS